MPILLNFLSIPAQPGPAAEFFRLPHFYSEKTRAVRDYSQVARGTQAEMRKNLGKMKIFPSDCGIFGQKQWFFSLCYAGPRRSGAKHDGCRTVCKLEKFRAENWRLCEIWPPSGSGRVSRRAAGLASPAFTEPNRLAAVSGDWPRQERSSTPSPKITSTARSVPKPTTSRSPRNARKKPSRP